MAGNKTNNITPEKFTNFGELLRYLRHRVAITQRELAIQVGYHYSYLSRIERNERFPEANIILARFVPALQLDGEPEWVARLVALAAVGRGEAKEAPPVTLNLTQTQTITTAAAAERLPLPPPHPPICPLRSPACWGVNRRWPFCGNCSATPTFAC
ncbi:MAG: helix-turn-helix transcriptional regulator [Chloroflexi bacterium]|nr:helix-turn-helix transcriptional regulator [Chloroflexota bacterium]